MPDFIIFLQETKGAFVGVAALFGLIVGSFLNVVIHRLPRMMEREWHENAAVVLDESGMADCARKLRAAQRIPTVYNLVVPRSACPECGRQVRAIENLPVISFLMLRARCAGCGSPISMRYPLVEAASGLLAGYAAWHFGFSSAALAACLISWSLIALTAIDIDTQLLPDDITLPLLWLGLIANISGTFAPLNEAVIGATVGYLSLWSVYWMFKLVTGKEGMGFGDFKLLAALGAWLGWKLLPMVILLSSVVGAVVGICLIALQRKGKGTPIPFGPYLAAAGLIALFWGDHINQTYLQLFR
jgi:leader peptidase (prepilin peptidase) / N-methyltransferase